jgi:hypothetical protein
MVYCPRCGRENSPGSIYCAYCGGAAAQLDLRSLENATAAERRILREEVAARPSGKEQVWKWLPIVAMLAYIVGYGIVMVGMISTVFSHMRDEPFAETSIADLTKWYMVVNFLVVLVTYLLLAATVYKILEVRGTHFRREVRFKNAVSHYVNRVADAREMPLTLTPSGGLRIEREPRRPLMGDGAGGAHSPLFWAALVFGGPAVWSVLMIPLYGGDMGDYILIIIPVILVMALLYIVFIYMLHKWMQEMHEHDRRWRNFAESTRAGMLRLGFDVQRVQATPSIPYRSSALYVVLSILLGIIFIAVWMYTIIDDQNQHISRQRAFESALLETVEPESRYRDASAQVPLP